jgi:hypothetical protein
MNVVVTQLSGDVARVRSREFGIMSDGTTGSVA